MRQSNKVLRSFFALLEQDGCFVSSVRDDGLHLVGFKHHVCAGHSNCFRRIQSLYIPVCNLVHRIFSLKLHHAALSGSGHLHRRARARIDEALVNRRRARTSLCRRHRRRLRRDRRLSHPRAFCRRAHRRRNRGCGLSPMAQDINGRKKNKDKRQHQSGKPFFKRLCRRWAVRPGAQSRFCLPARCLFKIGLLRRRILRVHEGLAGCFKSPRRDFRDACAPQRIRRLTAPATEARIRHQFCAAVRARCFLWLHTRLQ